MDKDIWCAFNHDWLGLDNRYVIADAIIEAARMAYKAEESPIILNAAMAMTVPIKTAIGIDAIRILFSCFSISIVLMSIRSSL